MITKRHLVIAVLCTFCLTFTLFTIVPAGSNYKTLGTGEYDPWLDVNEDGYINAKEAVQLGMAFDTFGDPTKNVNVTNWPSAWNFTISSQKTTKTIVVEVNKTIHIQRPPEDIGSLVCSFDTEGFSQITVFVKSNPTEGQPHCGNFLIYLHPSAGNITGTPTACTGVAGESLWQTSLHDPQWCSPNAEIWVNAYQSPDNGYVDFTVVAYLMA